MSYQLVKKIIVFCLVLVFIPASSVWAASVITDPALAKAIRTELKLSPGKELNTGDLQLLESLYPVDAKVKITHLQGLEYAVNMQSLFLPDQNIKDITEISKLKKLTFLAVEGNQITDLSPLSGLSSLQRLVVDDNKIKSLEPLKNLHKLTDLLASNNQVADLNPIKKLKLEWIIMSGNKIQDLTPLINHPTLEYLYLDDNFIRDIEVLKTIPNLSEVSLANNPLNEQASQVVKQLEKNGVIVHLVNEDETQSEEVQVSLDAESVAFDVPPFIMDGSTMVPFRVLFEKLGLKVTWIEDTQTIIGEKEGTTIRMQIGKKSADVNEKPISLAVAPTIISGSTFVPLRFLAESLDAKVEWDGSRKLAIIRSKQVFASFDGTVEVTAFGKWTTTEDTSKFVELAIETFSWSTLVVSKVSKQELTPQVNLIKFYSNTKTQLLTDPETYVMEEAEVTFQGNSAKKLVFHKMEDGWKPFVCTVIFFEVDGHFYQITASANEDILENAQEELNEIVGTLKLKQQQGK